ncbi:MAG: PilZ domain-containing protein, partial [Nitrospira sp.]|nr:PilZ domain-containing protein [Nitrospira sp.]
MPEEHKEDIERRAVPRYPVEVSVTFRWLDDSVEGTTMDLSVRGCTITVASPVLPPLTRGSFLILTLMLPHETQPVLINPAVVRWVQGVRFGVDFVSNRPADMQRLSRFLEGVAGAEQAS